MTRLVVTADADVDLNEVLDYLKQQASAPVAEEYGRKFRLCIERLLEFPGTGPRRPALGPNVRIGIVPPYILIYDYMADDDTLILLRTASAISPVDWSVVADPTTSDSQRVR